jgi:thioredoxin reductase (NADPH)
MGPPDTYDFVVVGAGPIGLETAAALCEEGLRVLVVDAGPVGATIARTFPPQTRFFTSPERLAIRGWPVASTTQEKTTGEEYLAFLRAFVTGKGLHVRTFQRVVAIDGHRGDFAVTTETPDGVWTVIGCRAIVLASGGTDHPRTLGVDGEDLAMVHHYLGDPHRFFDRTVLVVGGRNSAAESALRLYRIGARVHLVHRQAALYERIKHWIRPDLVSLIEEGEIVAHMSRVVQRFEPGLVFLSDPAEPGVTTDEVRVDDVVLQLGFEQDSTLFTIAGVDVDQGSGAPVIDPHTMESSVPGVYVVGTATAGTQQQFDVFIENSHQHADRVVAATTGRPAPPPVPTRPLPEM